MRVLTGSVSFVDLMRYLVDGYNVAHRLFGRDSRHARPDELREALLRRLRRFVNRRRKVLVVFDGEDGTSTSRFGAGELEIVYARSADDEIVRRVRSAHDPSAFRVVSADREVTGRSGQLGARIVRVIDFIDELDDVAGPDMEPGEPPEKYED